MNLALHQLRHEFRRSRVFLAVYVMILLGNLAVAAGWIGQPEYNPHAQGWGPQGMLPGFLAMAFWVAFALLIATSIAADSPVNRDRFLASRPLPKQSLVTAKGLFVLIAVVLPATILETCSLIVSSAPGLIIALGSIERFALLALIATFLGLFTTHWASAFTTKLALAVVFAAASAFLGGLSTIVGHLNRQVLTQRVILPEPTVLTAAIGLAAICLALWVTSTLRTRRQWKTRHLILPFTGLTLLWFAIATWCPVRSFSLPATDQAAVEQALDGKPDPIHVSPSAISYSTFNDGPAAHYHVRPALSGDSTPPQDWELRWSHGATTWNEGDTTIHRDPSHRPPAEDTVIASRDTPASNALLAALRAHAPGFRLLIPSGHGSGIQPQASLQLGMLTYLPEDAPPGPLTVESDIRASAYRWKLAAELPFGAKAPVSSGPWHLSAAPPNQHALTAYVTVDTHRLATTATPSPVANRYRWTRNVVFALHIPDREIVYLGSAQVAQWTPTLSSADRAFSEVSFNRFTSNAPALTAADRLSARLLILQAERIGTTTRTFRSPEFTLESRSPAKTARRASRSRPHKPQSTPAAFASWLTRHRDLPADLPADQLRAHLDALFNLAQRSGAYLDYHDSPAVRHLARFVPHHRDLFLDAIHGMTSRDTAARLVLHTLTQGTTEDDKAAIVAALPHTPILIETIKDRGWTAEARTEIVTLLRTVPANFEALQATASFNDPTLDGLLLKSFQASPSVRSYQALRAVPRLHDQLDATARDLWSPGLFVLNDNLMNWRLELALHQGRPDALAHLIKMLPFLAQNDSPAWRAGEVIGKVFLLPEDLRQHRHNSEKLLGWLRQHKAVDFRFDPILGRFVPADSNSI